VGIDNLCGLCHVYVQGGGRRRRRPATKEFVAWSASSGERSHIFHQHLPEAYRTGYGQAIAVGRVRAGGAAQRAGGGRHDGAAGTRGLAAVFTGSPAPSARALTASATGVPRQSGFAGVSCPTADRCVAVGQRVNRVNRSGIEVPLAEAWNGHRWKVQRARVPAGARTSRLEAVSCSSARMCMAVGDYTNDAGARVPMSQRWNGRRWAMEPIQAPGSFQTGMSCVSATACTAVGYTDTDDLGVPVAEQWNGQTWASQRIPAGWSDALNALTGVSCVSARACVASGYSVAGDGPSVPLAERWNGLTWEAQPIPSASEELFNFMEGVSCASAGACVAVGWSAPQDAHGNPSVTAPMAEIWSGGSWAVQPPPSPVGSGRLSGVSCGPAGCTAVGSAPAQTGGPWETLAERWDGTAWPIQRTRG